MTRHTTTAPSTSPAPLLDARLIGLAHYAGRGILEAVLARHGIAFQEQITLRPVALAEGPVERDALVRQIVGALKVTEAEVGATVDALIGRGLLAAEGACVRLTDDGRALHETATAEVRPISERIYAGLPAEDLAVAGRLLTLITERADAELAALR
ncbi:MarR family transcriptional regulator [Streptomyces sp. NPDC048290]|uniref:MarR family transcriptional regulator n=1 Tax=Streptomyces sp. NPDC048290 TaxID=3155811 RepID=UPI003434DD71